MKKVTQIAIDPGKSGAAAIKKPDGTILTWKADKKTYQDFIDFLKEHAPATMLMEQVHANSKNGCKANWGLSESNTIWRMASLINKIPLKIISPMKWMKLAGPFSKDRKTRKNEIKALAQRVYPDVKVTLWNADALALLSRFEEFYAVSK